MKKNILFTILPFIALGQVISPTNPYTKSFVASADPSTGFVRQSKQEIAPILSKIVQEFDSYWEGRDFTKKGSGYKPFKRWANHWENYLQKDGTIAPPAVLWEAWEKKKKNEVLASQLNQPNVPIPSWSNIGPAIVANSATTTSGQGRLNTIIKDPLDSQTIYVGAPAGGLWKSSDNGVNWHPLTDHLPQIGVSGIAIDPIDNNIIYIATGDDDAGDSYSVGVMKSLDGGLSWNSTGLEYNWTNYKTTNEIFIDPYDNNTIWVASTDGLQKSIDGGDSWTIKLPGIIEDFRFKPLSDLDISNGETLTIYAVGYDQDGISRFYKSIDAGESFSISPSIPENSNRIVLEVTKADSEKVYVLSAYDNGDGTYEGRNSFQGLYVSDNSGSDFTKTAENDDIFQSGQSWYDMALTVADDDPDIVFVGVLDIWKSIDGGNDFNQLNRWWVRDESFTHADIHFLRYFEGDLYAGTDGGIYRSSDNGDNFEDLSNTLSISQIYSVATSKPNSSKLASGLQDCGGFGFSVGTWNSYHGGDGMGTAVDPFDEDTYYGFTQYGSQLSVTTSGGQTSNMYIASGPVEGQWETPLQFAKNGELYSGFDQLYILNDNNWDSVSNHNFGSLLRHLEMDPNNTNIIYAATYNEVFKSNDRGKTFELILSTDYYYIRDIEVHNSDSNTLWVISSQELFESNDGGDSFVNLSSDLPAEANVSLAHQSYSDNDALYLGTLLGVYYKDNTLNSWVSISENLPNVKVSDMEINSNDNILTISTYGRGVWQTPIPPVLRPTHDLDLLDINTQIDSDFRCQNLLNASIKVYNNGTSPITSFSYESSLNNVFQGVDNWTGNLAAGEVLNLPLNIQDDPIIGINNFIVELSYQNETFIENNSMNIEFETDNPPNYGGQSNTTYTFETIEDDWIIVGDALWEKGIPDGNILNQVISGSNAYATNLSGNYPENSNSKLVSPCFDLSIFESGSVKFYIGYNLETDYDYLYFDYSVNGGLNWTNVDTFNGFDTTLKLKEYSLTQEMLVANVIFRFNIISDQYVHEEGAVIDDFIIEGTTLSLTNDFDHYITIYPNPTKDVITINTAGKFKINDINIFGLDSKRVYDSKSIISSTHTIDFTNHSKGLYFVELTTTDGHKIIRKLLVE